jgi:F0F1-type ATP synthase membrane subunit a
VNIDAAVWTVVVIAAFVFIIYAFQAARTHRLQTQQVEGYQKAVESQVKAMDRQTEAMERIAAALERSASELRR